MRTLLFFIINLFLSLQIVAQDTGDMSAEENAWMSFMQPGEMHEMLARQAGEWNVEAKMWMDPSAPPEITRGIAVSEMILGGRYLKTTQTGTSMGMLMEGIGIDAYDNVKKKFISIWIDNFGTGIAYAEGEYDAGKKMITSWGEMTDPVSGVDSKYKIVTTFIDDDTSIMEMYMVMGDSEIKTMEMKSMKVK